MKLFEWNNEKNAELRKTRGIAFEDVLYYISKGEYLDIIDNPNQEKYAAQRVFILKIDEYIYYVPFKEDDNVILLKTIIPSRKLTKIYLGDKKK